MALRPAADGPRRIAPDPYRLQQREVVQVGVVCQEAHPEKAKHVGDHAAEVAVNFVAGKTGRGGRPSAAKGGNQEDGQAARSGTSYH